MEPGASRAGAEELLANLGWVRRLALAIVRDASAADDVAQEVARVALERPSPVPAGGLRAWLGAVTRRLALDRTRSDAARRSRERSVARPEGDGSEPEIVERSARQQRAARAVMDLPEPYRSTILYRYLDEMPIAEVARRTGVNEAAVRKRLSRGLEMLRARLDAEFGTNTRGWALALLAPAKGAVLMSTKWIAAGGAAAVLGLGWWGWQAARQPGLSGPSNLIAAEPRLEAPSVAAAEIPAPAQPAREALAIIDGARATASIAEASQDGTILHVRVVDRAGVAVTKGRVECWWAGIRNVPHAYNRKFLDVEIRSEVTDVLLPAAAVEALVRAAVPGHLGTNDTPVPILRQGATGQVERDVTLTLDEPLQSRSIQGVVTLDGQRRLPRAFTIRYVEKHSHKGWARANVVDAAYALSNVSEGGNLWITSEETVPTQIVLTEEVVGSGVLDLELSSGRTLVLTLLDRDDGHPLAEQDFLVSLWVNLGGNVGQAETRSHRTDQQGVCKVRGLATGASVSIHPGLESELRALVFSGAQSDDPMTLSMLAEAWWSQRLSSGPPVIELTLRVKPVHAGARVHGSLPAALMAHQADRSQRIRVAATEVTGASARRGDAFEVPLDDQGNWSFPAHWPSRFIVWIERAKGRAVISREVEVALAAAGPHGPVDLPLDLPDESGPGLDLRMENVPAAGTVRVTVFTKSTTPRSETIDCEGPACTHRVKLPGPCNLTISWSPRESVGSGEIRRSFRVNPARERSLRVDLGGDQLRVVEFSVRGATIPSHAMLGFGKMEPAGGIGTEATSTTLTDGRVLGRLSLSPGQWFFECFDPQRSFNVTGVIDVAAGSDTIRIEREAVIVNRAQAPRGIELTELDGVKLDLLERRIRIPWTSSDGTVVLNATARYTPIP